MQHPVAHAALLGGGILPNLDFSILARNHKCSELGAVGSGIASLALDSRRVARGREGLRWEGERNDGGWGVVEEADAVEREGLC